MELMIIVVIFFAVLAVFLGITCFSPSRRARIIGAVVAFGWACLMFMAANMAESFNLNIWYSQAADDLLESSIEAIDAGDADHVSAELAAMREKLQVTYEFRGNFKELAIATTERIRSRPHPETKFKIEAEQDGAGQPATRSELKSGGNENPNPETEGRSR